MKLPRALGADRSLAVRLLLFAGAAIALALALAWFGLGLLFERHSERQLVAELERHGLALIAAVELDASGKPVLRGQPPDPRFTRPASGLYWRVKAPAGELRSRSLWDGMLPPVRGSASGWSVFDAAGPFEPRVLVVARMVRPAPNDPGILVEIAADRRSVTEARSAFGRESAIFLALLWVALAAAAWVQVRLGLRPLARVGGEVNAMAGAIEARLDEHDHPVEVRPLTSAINAFADRRARDIEQARQRARDLAHALKTPITALRVQVEALSPEKRREMVNALSLLSGAVEGELARTGEQTAGQSTSARLVVERIMSVISRTSDGARLSLGHNLPADLDLPMSMEAALEAIGAIVENAARYASRKIEIAGTTTSTRRSLTVCDDGPGIPAGLRAAALDRGTRLDERGTSHGLGLSIAQQLVEANGGALALEEAPQGGLCVRMCWQA